MAELRIFSEPAFNEICTTSNYEVATSSSDKKNNKINYHDHDDLELGKISVKRYKKSDKIYDQHYDHSNAKNIKIDCVNENHLAEIIKNVPKFESPNNTIIDCVNDDCLAEIFMYLPACERPKLALVCKKWKRALDNAWYDVRKVELIYWRYGGSPNCLAKYQTIDGLDQLSFLESLLAKCGRYLTKLDLTAYDRSNIMPVINEACPNLVKLRLRFTYVDDVTLDNAFSRLSKLKELTIIFHFFEKKCVPVNLINSLKDIADTLTDLNLLNWMYGFDQKGWIEFPTDFIWVLPKLKALKKLEVAGIYVPRAVSHYVKYYQIFITDYYIYWRQKSNHQFNVIENLDLSQYRVTDDCLFTIANAMMFLKVLYIFCEWVTDDGVVAISKMLGLHTLEFIGRNNVTDSSIKLLKNLKKLKLPISNKITDVSVTKVLKNSPNMDELYVEDTGVTVEFIKKAANISKNRKRLLRLFYSSVTSTPQIEQYKSQYFGIQIVQQEQKQKITEAHANSPFIENVRVHFL